MVEKTVIISCLLITLFFSGLHIASASSKSQQEDSPESITGEDERSFYHRVLYGKYNLIEDDFYDVPHRPSKFDYIREKMEELRAYTRPKDEFAILNLQWDDGKIFINDFKTVEGKTKEKRGFFLQDKKNRYFYRLFSDRNLPTYEEYFDVPVNLNYDFLDEETGRIGGGTLSRQKADFAIKIPLYDKSANKIIFFKETLIKSDLDWIKEIKDGDSEPSDFEITETILGEIPF